MAFDKANWGRQTDAMNTGGVTVDAVIYNSPAIFSYRSAADDQATIAGGNYFANARYDLAINDLIFVVDSLNAYKSYQVDAIDRDAGTITTSVITW